MKTNHSIFFATVAMLLFASNANAQTQQTAEGAQEFLALMAQRGFASAWLRDAQGRANYVSGKHVTNVTVTKVRLWGDPKPEPYEHAEEPAEKFLSGFGVPELDSIGRDNAPDACITRVAKIDFRETVNDTKGAHWDNGGKFAIDVFDRTENWEYENQLVKFAPPHHIDWRGNTKVGRSDDGATVWVSADRNEGAYSPTLAFKPGDAETADRIEYAMKFLQASCDVAANTGF